MPQFELANALPQIVWLALIFAILYLTLATGALPKVEKVVEERSRAIGGDLLAADAAKGQAETTLAAYEASLAEARGKAAALTSDAKAASAKATSERVKASDAALAAKLDAATAEVAKAREAALANLDAVAADATADIVEKLIGRRPDPAAAAAAVAQARG